MAHGLSCSVACEMWVLPSPGIASMSPALAGNFFTIEPPGKPYLFIYLFKFSAHKKLTRTVLNSVLVDFPTLCYLISLRTQDHHFTGDKTKARSWAQNND